MPAWIPAVNVFIKDWHNGEPFFLAKLDELPRLRTVMQAPQRGESLTMRGAIADETATIKQEDLKAILVCTPSFCEAMEAAATASDLGIDYNA